MPCMISPRFVGNAIVCSLLEVLSMSIFAEFQALIDEYIRRVSEPWTIPWPNMARRRNLIASFIVFRLSEIKKAAI